MNDIRARIDHAFEAFGRSVYHHQFKTLGVMVLVLAAFLSQLPKLAFDTSTESYFRKDDPTIGDYNRFREQFGREELGIIAVTPPDVFNTAFLKKLRAFHREIEEKVPYLKELTSLVNVRDTRGEGDRLIVEDLLKEIPETPEAMARLKERVLGSHLYPDYLISADGTLTTLIVETLAFSPGKAGGDLMAGFQEADKPAAPAGAAKRKPLSPEENRELVLAIKEIAARYHGPDFPIHVAGSPVVDEFFDRTMQKDMGQFMGLAVLAIGIFLLVLFRRLSGVVLPMLVVILSLLSTVGLMAGAGVPFTIPTTVLPSFLLAVGVGASVHLLAIFFREFQRSGEKEEALAYALGHSGLPIVMTSLTTAAGLYAFMTAQMAPVAHLGVFAGTGVLIALVYTLVLVPAILSIWPVRRNPRFGNAGRAGGFDRFLGWVADLAINRAKEILIISAVLSVAAVVGLFYLRFSMDFIGWIPRSQEIRRDMDLIDEKMKGSIALELVIDTGRENGLYEPAVMEAMAGLAAYAESLAGPDGAKVVGKTNSVVDVLRETNQALNENRPDQYKLPGGRALIAQELLLFENSGSDNLERLVDTRFSKARLTLIVPNHDAAFYVQFVERIKTKAAQLMGAQATVTVTGTLRLFTQMIFNMMRSMAQSYVIAAVVITLLMILLIGSIRIGLLSMLVNFSPILVTMGLVMGFGGINLDAFTLLIGSIALGLAVDDTIHFFHNFRRYFQRNMDAHLAIRETLLTSGRAMLFTSLVLVTGFWLFMFATLYNVFYFGLLTGIALLLALAADFLMAPAILVVVAGTSYGRDLTARWCNVPAEQPA